MEKIVQLIQSAKGRGSRISGFVRQNIYLYVPRREKRPRLDDVSRAPLVWYITATICSM